MSSVVGEPWLFAAKGAQPDPFTYTVPQSLEVETGTTYCAFDGSGAGGDFVLRLSFISSNGNVIARMPTGRTISAGETGSVSWFPLGGSNSSGVIEVVSPDLTITVTNPFGPVVDIDLPFFATQPAVAYDADALVSISDAFDQGGDSYAWWLPGDNGSGTLPNSVEIGEFAYVVVDPTKFLAHEIAIPFGRGVDVRGQSLLGGPPAYGNGYVLQTGSGNVYPFTLELYANSDQIMVMRLAGTPGSPVTATNPVVLAAGDRIVGAWSAMVRGE